MTTRSSSCRDVDGISNALSLEDFTAALITDPMAIRDRLEQIPSEPA
jgi:hypothetical protein